MKKDKWFYGVDSIRFILAFIVLISHSHLIYATVLKQSTHPLLRYLGVFTANAFDGTSAVIAFFIISVSTFYRQHLLPNFQALIFFVLKPLPEHIEFSITTQILKSFLVVNKTLLISLF